VSAAQTILIVDDDDDFVAVSRAALESAGYEVLTAGDAASGLQTAIERRPGLIVLDLMMEETDSGVRLAHELRRDPGTRDTPIVILTAVRNATGFDFAPIAREDYEWIGADEWIEKPISPRDLVSLAARLLEGAIKEGEPS
jgi:CheY-like chemotaxis protein